MTKALLGFMTGVTYYASPEMRHLEAVLPNALTLAVDPGYRNGYGGLYDGLPAGDPVPWWSWVVPLWSWGSFLVVLYVVLVCLAVLHEKAVGGARALRVSHHAGAAGDEHDRGAEGGAAVPQQDDVGWVRGTVSDRIC